MYFKWKLNRFKRAQALQNRDTIFDQGILYQGMYVTTLSFSVSTENFGFTVSTPFFFLKNLFLNSKMHVNHSLVAVI